MQRDRPQADQAPWRDATGDPGDRITIGVQMAQSFYGDFLFGDRYTCGGQGRQVASIPIVAPSS